jgi:hypothetical protein
MEPSSDHPVSRAEYEEVARWMVTRIRERGRVPLTELTSDLRERFGLAYFTDWRAEGTLAGRLLSTFRRTHAGSIRWVQAGQYWTAVRDRVGAR